MQSSQLCSFSSFPMCCFYIRTPQSWELSSLAKRATTTLLQRAAAGVPEEAGGTMASQCKLQRGSLCSCARRSRSRRSGWRRLERLSPNPWLQRITLVGYWPGTDVMWYILVYYIMAMSQYTIFVSISSSTDEANLSRGKWLERWWFAKVQRQRQCILLSSRTFDNNGQTVSFTGWIAGHHWQL